MKTKRIIKRNLPLNDKYTFVGITDLGDMNFQTCQNCGAVIRYCVELKNSQNKSFFVGTECAKTLQKVDISNSWSMIEQMNAFKKIATAKNLILKGSKLRIYEGFDYLYIVGLNSRGTAKKMYIERVFDVFMQKHYYFIDSFISDVKINHRTIKNDWCMYDVLEYYKELKNQS